MTMSRDVRLCPKADIRDAEVLTAGLAARGHMGVLGSEGLFHDRQRALVERFGLGVAALSEAGWSAG